MPFTSKSDERKDSIGKINKSIDNIQTGFSEASDNIGKAIDDLIEHQNRNYKRTMISLGMMVLATIIYGVFKNEGNNYVSMPELKAIDSTYVAQRDSLRNAYELKVNSVKESYKQNFEK
jgi:hypothetical protein